jgi:hypothetical protein
MSRCPLFKRTPSCCIKMTIWTSLSAKTPSKYGHIHWGTGSCS